MTQLAVAPSVVPSRLSIASEYTLTPGPRSESLGPYSGERFLRDLLHPRFKDALDRGQTLTVDLDGTAGYATSFLEAAFGGLAREFGRTCVRRSLTLVSNEEPYLLDEIWGYVDDVKNP